MYSTKVRTLESSPAREAPVDGVDGMDKSRRSLSSNDLVGQTVSLPFCRANCRSALLPGITGHKRGQPRVKHVKPMNLPVDPASRVA